MSDIQKNSFTLTQDGPLIIGLNSVHIIARRFKNQRFKTGKIDYFEDRQKGEFGATISIGDNSFSISAIFGIQINNEDIKNAFYENLKKNGVVISSITGIFESGPSPTIIKLLDGTIDHKSVKRGDIVFYIKIEEN